VGFVCAVFFIILSISGVLLMHYESFGLNKVVVSGKFLPDKYFQLAAAKRSIQAISATENGTLFVGTDYGLYRSRDEGETWTQLDQGLFNQNIHVLAVDPVENDVVYAGTAGGIFKTENGGDHWTDWFDASSGLTNGEVNDLVIHPDDSVRLFAATEGGLFYSEDAGDSWELIFGGEDIGKGVPVKLVRLSSVDPSVIHIVSENGMYRKNGGEEWEPIWKNQISEVLSMVSLKTDPEFIYVGTRNGLFKSFNRGRNWVKDKNITTAPSLLVNPSNIANLMVTTGKKIFVSGDGGDSWKPVKSNPKQQSSSGPVTITRIYQTTSPSSVLLAGTTSGLFLSRDGGDHWQEPELSNSGNNSSPEERKMDLVKLITEIHTGRFFGNYFMLLVDLATLGLVLLVFSGIKIGLNQNKIKRRKKEKPTEELEVDLLVNVQETAGDLNHESHEIHDMIEHIGNHLEKCKTIYMRKEKKEIEEIGRHITTLDKKMHHLMRRIGEFEDFSQN